MYCKHCGKQIADDSVYCQHCGGKQDADLPSETISNVDSEKDKVINKVELKHTFGKKEFSLFSSKYHKYWIIYAIWVFINIIIWNMGDGYVKHGFFDEGEGKPSAYFYPFQHCTYYDFNGSGRKTYESFDTDTYDITEFILYVIIVPLLIIAYFKYLHEPLKKILNS